MTFAHMQVGEQPACMFLSPTVVELLRVRCTEPVEVFVEECTLATAPSADVETTNFMFTYY